MSLIRIEGYDFAIDAGSFRMQINNAFFVDEAIQGSLSFPLSLPATDSVKSFTTWLNKPSVTFWENNEATFNAEYIDDGAIIFRGVLLIQRASSKKYDFSFAIGLTELQDVKDKSLRSINMGGKQQVVTTQSVKYEFNGTSFSSIYVIYDAYYAQAISFNTSVNQTLLDLKASFDSYVSGLITAGSGYNKFKGHTVTVDVVADTITFTCDWEGAVDVLRLVFYTSIGSFTPHASFNLVTDEKGFAWTSSCWAQYMWDALSFQKPAMFLPVRNDKANLVDKDASSPTDEVVFDTVFLNAYAAGYGAFSVDKTASGPVRSALSVITPFPRVEHVMKMIMQHIGYAIEGGVFSLEEIKRMVMWSSYTVNYRNSSVTEGAYNYIYGDYYEMQQAVPDKTIAEFFKAIKEALCISFYPDHINKTLKAVFNKDVIMEPCDADDDWTKYLIKQSDIVDYSSRPTGFKLNYGWDSNDEVPNELLPDLSPFIILPPVDDIADLPEPLNNTDLDLTLGTYNVFENEFYKQVIIFVKSKGCYYKVSYLDSGLSIAAVYDGWVKVAENLFPLTVGDGSTEITLSWDTLLNIIAPGFGSTWRNKLPYVKTEMNYRVTFMPEPFDNASRESNDFGFRFFFYRGFANDEAGNSYPFASFDTEKYDGLFIPDSFDLSLSGLKGLKETTYKEYLAVRFKGRPVEFYMDLPKNLIQNPKLWKKKHIAGSNYIIKTIDVQLPIKGPCLVKAIRIPGELSLPE